MALPSKAVVSGAVLGVAVGPAAPGSPDARSLAEVARLLALRIRAARAERKLTRKRLAERAQISERYLSQLETEEANVSIAILMRVANALEIDFRELLALEDHERAPEIKGWSVGHGAFGGTLGDGNGTPLNHGLANLSSREIEHLMPILRRSLESYRASRRGIALLGLRGAGKSTLGRAFAARHGLTFVSVTREVEARAGMSLNELFNLGGPDAYRAIETEVIEALSRGETPIVLETSGGIVGNQDALDLILTAFKTVWLKAEPEDHLARVAQQGDARPMAGNPRALDQVRTLLRQRETEYARAEAVIDTSGRSIEACLTALEAIVGLKRQA